MTIHYNSSQIFPTCLKSIEHHNLDAISSIDKKQPLDDFLLHSGDLNPISIHKTFFSIFFEFYKSSNKNYTGTYQRYQDADFLSYILLDFLNLFFHRYKNVHIP